VHRLNASHNQHSCEDDISVKTDLDELAIKSDSGPGWEAELSPEGISASISASIKVTRAVTRAEIIQRSGVGILLTIMI
jgi:hypothetical protein